MHRSIYTAIFTILFLSIAHAQDTTSIATEKVEVIKNYEAIIQQAKKKNIPKNALAKKQIPIAYDYKIQSDAILDFERAEEIIRPKTYSDSDTRNEDIKDGSIYGGYGNFSSLNFGAAYHYYIEDWLNAGFSFDHISAKDPDLAHQKFNNNTGRFYGNYFLSPKSSVGLEAAYQRSNHNTAIGDSIGVLSHTFENIGGGLNFNTTAFESAGISFRLKSSYDQIKQKEDQTKESLLNAEANLFKRINDKINIEIPFLLRKYDFNLDSINHKPLDLILRPQLGIKNETWSLKAGVEYVKADTSNYIFPILSIFLEDIYEGIDIHLFTSSHYERNSMHNLSEINPYYRTDLTNLSVNYLRSYNIEISKSIQDFDLSMRIRYNDYTGDDIHFDRSDTNRAFVNALDRKEWQLVPRIKFSSEFVKFNLSYQHSIFQGDSKNLLMYRPESKLELGISEDLLNSKLKLSQTMSYMSSRKNFHQLDEDNLLDPFLDISLMLYLRISKSISVYARALNLLASEYELWYGHPVFERQILAGLKFNI